MSQAATRDGEFIALHFDDHPGYEVIKGWQDIEVSQLVLAKEFGLDAPRTTEVRHTYAFWAVSRDEVGDSQQKLMLRDTPGPGRFRVTIAVVDGFLTDRPGADQPAAIA